RVLLGITFVLGALAFVPAWLVEQWISGGSEIDEHARASNAAAYVYAFLVAAPMEQGLKVAAVVPARRATRFASAGAGVLYASAAGLGFVSVHDATLLAAASASKLDAGRALLAAPAHVFFAAAWGFALGREAAKGKDRARTIGGRAFNLTWL